MMLYNSRNAVSTSARYGSFSLNPRTHSIPLASPILSAALRNTQFARSLHVFQSPTSSLPPASLDASQFVKNVPEIGAKTSDNQASTDITHTAFNVIGSQGTILQVALPASTPLYARRRSLLAALSNSSSSSPGLSLTSTLHFSKNLFSRIVSGNYPLVHQKFVSAEPTSLLLQSSATQSTSVASSLLVSTLHSLKPSKHASSPSNSIAVISLDGRIDWILTPVASVFAYSPFSSSLFFIPSSASSASGRQQATTITGRGIVAITPKSDFFNTLVGSSRGISQQVFKVVLKDDESMLVEKNALLGYSLDSQDLRNLKYPSGETLPKSFSEAVDHDPEETDSITTQTEKKQGVISRSLAPIAAFLKPIAFFTSSASKIASTTAGSIASIFASPSPYIRVYGPSTILLTSSPSPATSGFKGFFITSFKSLTYGVSTTIVTLWNGLRFGTKYITLLFSRPSFDPYALPSNTPVSKPTDIASILESATPAFKSLESQAAKILLQELKDRQAQASNVDLQKARQDQKGFNIVRIGKDGKAKFESVNNFGEFL